ncbi:MAG: hypothetical protein FK731_06340 [Asgard group archaeon]|nr:hypothetical protein [Asgard group archaeon]
MKKIVKILISVLILGVIISPTIVTGNYQVTVGQSFTYDVINASIKTTIDGNTASGNGYFIDSQHFTNGTQIEVEITEVIPTGSVNWTLSSGVYNEEGYSSVSIDNLGLSYLLIYPFYTFEGFGLMTWNDISIIVSGGLNLILLPFWDTYYFLNFQYLASDPFLTTYRTLSEYTDVTIEGRYRDTNNEMSFEWLMGGSMIVQVMDFVFNHQFKTVYDLTTGVLKGILMKSYIEGTYGEKEISIEMFYHCETVGYDIDDFYFETINLYPTEETKFETYLVLIGICIATIPFLLKIKRKYISN